MSLFFGNLPKFTKFKKNSSEILTKSFIRTDMRKIHKKDKNGKARLLS